MTWIYDIETMVNYFSAVFINADTKELKSFQLLYSDKEINELKELLEFLNYLYINKATIVGFNNNAFDMQVINKLHSTLLTVPTDKVISIIYKWAQDAIDAEMPEIRSKDFKIKNLDLFKLNHFDSKAKRGVSLKWLAYVMDSKLVQDMPYKHYERISAKQAEEIMMYNINDVKVTLQLYEYNAEPIAVRKELSELYSMDLMNYSEPKIVKQTLLKDLAKDLKVKDYTLKEKRVKNPFPLSFDKLIFDYIEFKSPQFNALKNYLKSLSVTETKGVFIDIPVTPDMNDLMKYVPSEFVKTKKTKNGVTTILEKLAIKFGDTVYVYGSGGIHSHTKDLVVDNSEYQIVDLDVTSYYPMTGIVNELYPRHLGKAFCDRYLWYFEKRKNYKKGTTLNYFYKLLLNTIYGLSNEENGFLYDPYYTMSITINGQLMLSMLIEMIELAGVGKCLTANTDGATFATNDVEPMMELVKKWESITKLSMERADYKKLVMRDVNNYVWIETNGKAKVKGYFKYPKHNEEFHKSRDMKIVVDSLVKFIVEGKDIYENILSCNDVLMFKKGVKTTGKMYFVEKYYDNTFTPQYINHGKVCRYFVSHGSSELFKRMPPLKKAIKDINQISMFDSSEIDLVDRDSSVEAGYACSIFNDMDNIPATKINKVYYLIEAHKILKRLYPAEAKKLMTKIKTLENYYRLPPSKKPVLDDFTKLHI